MGKDKKVKLGIILIASGIVLSILRSFIWFGGFVDRLELFLLIALFGIGLILLIVSVVKNTKGKPTTVVAENESNFSKIKNGLLLCGAILGAIFGAVVAITSITSGDFGGYTTIWVGCGVGTIVFGIMLCLPNLRKNLFLIIAEIAIIIGILTNSLAFVNQSSWYRSYKITGIEALIAFSIIIPLILLAGLIIPNRASETNTTNKEANIALLKKMKAEGEINEEEYKDLLMKELNK